MAKHGHIPRLCKRCSGPLTAKGICTRCDKTASGKTITDELIGKLADKAEEGYDVEEILWERFNQKSYW